MKTCLQATGHPGYRWQDSKTGYRREQGRSRLVAKGTAESIAGEANTTNANQEVGPVHSSVEGTVMVLERRGWHNQFHINDNQRMGGSKKGETKSLPITKRMVYNAYLKVRRGGKAAGVDKMILKDLESDLGNQLYKLWNRMSSGSYFPPPVREHKISKKSGGVRKLGIPTLLDRIAQTVVKDYLSPRMEAEFHDDSFGYRPNRSAHDALRQVANRNRAYPWVIDMDIRSFFDEVSHSLLSKALDRQVEERWIRMYIDRWLTSDIEQEDGSIVSRTQGTPQGGVISPLLANLFLHYVFDKWMEKKSHCPFTRYADDIIVHCGTYEEAHYWLESIKSRLADCGLRLHPEKTQIVYCGRNSRKVDKSIPRKFSFLGFDFRPRRKFSPRSQQAFTGYGCIPSSKRMSEIMQTCREHCGHKSGRLAEIARKLNPKIRGWLQYYSLFDRWALSRVMDHLNLQLKLWLSKTHKRFQNRRAARDRAMRGIYRMRPDLFEHWDYGYRP